MAIIDFLKKFFSGEEKKEARKVAFNEISKIIDEQKAELEKSTEYVKKQINYEISNSAENLRKKIVLLKEISLDERKEKENIKFLVKENLKVYLNNLEKFIKDIESFDEKELKNYLIRINSLINNFQKNSRTSFEKATILIGDELGKTREIVRSLSLRIKELAENKELGKIEKINEIKEKVEQIKSTENIIKEIEKDINKKKEEIRKKEEARREIEKELEKLKESEEHKKDLERKKQREKEIEKLNQKVYEIKEKIDLKHLMSIFHSDDKKRDMIKRYDLNFLETLDQDSSLLLLKLIKEAKPGLNINLEEIKEEKEELDKELVSEIDKQLKNKENEIRKINEYLEEIEKEISREKEKKKKLEEKNKCLAEEIKNDASFLNIEVS